MKKVTFLALAALALLSACNTMEGLGRDVQVGGNALEETAQDNKE